MFEWKELLPGKIWLCEDAIDYPIETVESLLEKSHLEQVANTYAYNYTPLGFKVMTEAFHLDERFRDLHVQLADRFNEIANLRGLHFSLPARYGRQMFLKYCGLGDRIAMHFENPSVHGPLAFAWYCTDETSSPLQWLSEQGESDYLDQHPEERDDYTATVEAIRRDGHERVFFGDISYYPRRNTMLVFETNGCHVVPPQGPSNNRYPRLTVFGWPFTIK